MINLTTAIFGKMTSAAALYADVGGRLYGAEAPEDSEFPYVVYSVVSDLPEYPGGKTIEKALIQFSLYSTDSGSTEVDNMLTDLRTLYDDCTLTITSNTLIYFIRGNLTTMRDDVTTLAGTKGLWHYAQEYECWMVKS